jgi:hypothetical protein
VVVACCTAAAVLIIAQRTSQRPPSDVELTEVHNNPFLMIGKGFHFFDVKSNGFDDKSLQQRVRLDAADQDANAALQWGNAERLRREGEENGAGASPLGEVREPKAHPKTRRKDGDDMWETPARQSEEKSYFKAMAPPGFSRHYIDSFGGRKGMTSSTQGTVDKGDADGGRGGDAGSAGGGGAGGGTEGGVHGGSGEDGGQRNARQTWASGQCSDIFIYILHFCPVQIC